MRALKRTTLALFGVLWLLTTLASTLAHPIHALYRPLSSTSESPPNSINLTFLAFPSPIHLTLSTSNPEPLTWRRQPTSTTDAHQDQYQYQIASSKPWMNRVGYVLLLYSFGSCALLMLLWCKAWVDSRLEPTNRFLWGWHPLRHRYADAQDDFSRDPEQQWYGADLAMQIRAVRQQRMEQDLRQLGMI